LNSNVTGIILSGGKSTRMNAPKTLIRVAGERIIDRQIAALRLAFGRVVVVGSGPEIAGTEGVRIIPDDASFSGMSGPMRGICTALRTVGGACFVVACDMPFINPRLMSHLAGLLAGHDLVIPVVNGLVEPLFGVYGLNALKAIEGSLMRGGRRIRDVFGSLDVLYVDEDELKIFDEGLNSFINVNTPSDLARAEDLAAGERSAGYSCGLPQKTY
jgi:molybdenum cofactor guanylyltransferase